MKHLIRWNAATQEWFCALDTYAKNVCKLLWSTLGGRSKVRLQCDFGRPKLRRHEQQNSRVQSEAGTWRRYWELGLSVMFHKQVFVDT